MKNLTGKVAIVTGAGSGIGAATAEILAQRGARVVLAGRNQDSVKSTSDRLVSQGLECLPQVADVSSEREITSLFNRTLEIFGPVDILVNCAAVITNQAAEDLEIETWNEIQAINVTGTFLCCREAMRQMKGRGGSIVNVSSLGGIQGTEKFPGFSAYTASKYAVIGLTEALAVEGRPHGVRINCVAPGAVDTKMLKKAAPFLRTQTRPEDIAQIILFLCDPGRSRSLNGSILPVHSNL